MCEVIWLGVDAYNSNVNRWNSFFLELARNKVENWVMWEVICLGVGFYNNNLRDEISFSGNLQKIRLMIGNTLKVMGESDENRFNLKLLQQRRLTLTAITPEQKGGGDSQPITTIDCQTSSPPPHSKKSPKIRSQNRREPATPYI
ncbi:hypothetical protein CDAR_316631 [Caerostris darwini]|uniref:LAGLIDADG homing endonuclease n=1 Tax=Caerostris darwini TaxID=1538125 RepID=A0AAV4UJA4_9ARAC|nr:hypothetical protein CDAR_316631 [Caerostris darwini]